MTGADYHPACGNIVDVALLVRALLRQGNKPRGLAHQEKAVFPEMGHTAYRKMFDWTNGNRTLALVRGRSEKKFEQQPALPTHQNQTSDNPAEA
jgi:hypothetical protein